MHEFPVCLKLSSQLCLFKWHCHCPLAIDPGCPPPHHRCARLWWDLCDVICPKSTFGRWFWCMGNCSGGMLRHVLHLKKCQKKGNLISWISLRQNIYDMYICGLGKSIIITTSPDVTPRIGLLSRLSESSLTALNSASELFQFAQLHISFNTTYAAFRVANSFKPLNAAEPKMMVSKPTGFFGHWIFEIQKSLF